MQTDINRHFDLNSCSHGVKIKVKQIDDNYAWLYNENQYLYVELSDFCNYVCMLLDSGAHFTTFNSKATSVTRQLIPKTSHTQEGRISFVWQHRH